IIKEGDGGKILTVSTQGIGRKSDYSDYRAQNRGGYGTINFRTERFGDVAAVRVVYDDDDAILITESGVMIRLSCEEIRECARPSKGVIVMKLNEGDKVITMTTAKRSEDEKTEPLPEDAADDDADGLPEKEEDAAEIGDDLPAEEIPEE
ncbi:MAG: DNA gyrase subunit A, partial [Clostridia bacterium]|nr:DNA gyrase subunit A [Clostridia bacterium]